MTTRRRIDWEAIERDYRTGKFTLRELEAKHVASYSEISRRAKREGWQKDLAAVIRQATNAALLADTATKAQSDATTVVLVAAEVNRQVILGHRTRLAQLSKDADTARAKVIELADSAADIREAAVVVGALEALARLTKTVIDKEREAFGIGADDGGDDDGPSELTLVFR